MLPELPNTIEACYEIIKLLFNKIEQLERENVALKEQLNNNSSNSSLRPSSDFKKKKKKNTRVSSGKPSGGQVGHQGHHRALAPIEKVDCIERCELPSHCLCGGAIKARDEYLRHQVYELPKLKLKITEYQLEKGCCESCCRKHIAALPTGVSWGITGPRLTSFMSTLVSKYGLSRREQKGFLAEYFQFHLSLGTVFNKQKLVNAAMEVAVAGLLPIVKESPSVHSDETGHCRDGKTQWMWGFISAAAAFFAIMPSRGKKVLKEMMGNYQDVVVSDRYAAYNIFEDDQRQLCWAHLKRDFTKLSEKENKMIARIGRNLLESESALFKVWHQFKAEALSRNELLEKTEPIRQRFSELLEQGSHTDPILKAARFCKNLLEKFDALWTFLEREHVEPTNNHAERSLCAFVIWRKKYFCTRSDYGTEFVARSASIQTTCKLQGKSSFEFLCLLIKNHFAKVETSADALMA